MRATSRPATVPQRQRQPHRQRGAALLIALLTVALVATFAATAAWQQWRASEIEAAERARLQSGWVLIGALDWSRLILNEDQRAGRVDHLAEPWAVPLAEARLSSFLAADRNVASDALEGLPDAFLSGRIMDAQAKLNVRNLVRSGEPDAKAQAAFRKLFELLGLPPEQVNLMVVGLQRAARGLADSADRLPPGMTPSGPEDMGDPAPVREESPDSLTPLMPQRLSELAWLGLPASTIQAIEPYVTLLPTVTTVNLNTASAEVLAASLEGLDLAGARRVTSQRQRKIISSPADANEWLPQDGQRFSAAMHGVASEYFEVNGRLRLDDLWVEEKSLLRRSGQRIDVIWRIRGAGTTEAALTQ